MLLKGGENTRNLDSYLNAKHVLVSGRREGTGVEDYALSRVVSETDLLLTLPETYAALFASREGNVVLPIPFPINAVEVHFYWNEKLDHDPAMICFKEQVLNIFKHATKDLSLGMT